MEAEDYENVIIKGIVIRETQSGMAWVFRPDDLLTAGETILLPKSQVAVVRGTAMERDQVTMPRWLAEDRGLA